MLVIHEIQKVYQRRGFWQSGVSSHPRLLTAVVLTLRRPDFERWTEGVGPWAGAVQTGAVRPDRDAGQHDVHSDGDERRPLPGHLSPAQAHLPAQDDDWRGLGGGAGLRHAATLHLQTGLAVLLYIGLHSTHTYKYMRCHYNLITVSLILLSLMHAFAVWIYEIALSNFNK